MNRKGEMNAGVLLAIFTGVIVALALYTSSITYYGTTSRTYKLENQTYTFPALGARLDLVGQEYISDVIVQNASNASVLQHVPASNYTLAETVSTVDGLKRISITGKSSTFNGMSVNISYVYGPEGYIDSSAARSVADLIAVFAALAIGIFVLVPVLREKFDF